MNKAFKGGIPIRDDVDRVTVAFSDREPGDVISYRAISSHAPPAAIAAPTQASAP
jgi:hypothetical protein